MSISFFYKAHLFNLGSNRASSPKAVPSKHKSLYSNFVQDDNYYTPLLDVNPPVESPRVEYVPFAQPTLEDSTPKVIFADDNPPLKGFPKHGEDVATRTISVNPSHC